MRDEIRKDTIDGTSEFQQIQQTQRKGRNGRDTSKNTHVTFFPAVGEFPFPSTTTSLVNPMMLFGVLCANWGWSTEFQNIDHGTFKKLYDPRGWITTNFAKSSKRQTHWEVHWRLVSWSSCVIFPARPHVPRILNSSPLIILCASLCKLASPWAFPIVSQIKFRVHILKFNPRTPGQK